MSLGYQVTVYFPVYPPIFSQAQGLTYFSINRSQKMLVKVLTIRYTRHTNTVDESGNSYIDARPDLHPFAHPGEKVGTMITKFVETNGIQLFVVQEGPKEGPLVILLHGFPEFWHEWRQQMELLAAAGYRVWVPDMRGYHLSDKPKDVDEYTLDKLAGDVVGLIDAAGAERALLVGHDWGAVVAWWAAQRHPERLEKMVALSAPHPLVLLKTLRSGWEQRRKSWYMYFFRLPKLPEALLGARKWRALEQSMRSSALPGTFTDEDMIPYHKAWSQPGALTAMLNYYRALFRQQPGVPASLSASTSLPQIHVPTLMIAGDKDELMASGVASESVGLCEHGRLEVVPGATHWIPHEKPAEVDALIQRFFESDPVAEAAAAAAAEAASAAAGETDAPDAADTVSPGATAAESAG